MGGAASSANKAYVDPTWENQLEGEWRTARARELDRLGGAEENFWFQTHFLKLNEPYRSKRTANRTRERVEMC